MTTPSNIVQFHQDGQTLAFRVVGRGTMQHSPALRQLAEEQLGTGILRISVDLRACVYMDSTFLGTLIVLNKYLADRGGKLFLVAASAECRKLLRQMGLADYLEDQAEETSPQNGWKELPSRPADMNTFRRTVEQAHQELAKLPGEAGEQFQEVLRCMSRTSPSPTPTPIPSRDNITKDNQSSTSSPPSPPSTSPSERGSGK